jgi:hypothetical protein
VSCSERQSRGKSRTDWQRLSEIKTIAKNSDPRIRGPVRIAALGVHGRKACARRRLRHKKHALPHIDLPCGQLRLHVDRCGNILFDLLAPVMQTAVCCTKKHMLYHTNAMHEA